MVIGPEMLAVRQQDEVLNSHFFDEIIYQGSEFKGFGTSPTSRNYEFVH